MILICGSYALQRYYSGARTPVDLDILCDWDTLIQVSEYPGVQLFPLSGKQFAGTYNGRPLEVTVVKEGSTDEDLMRECWGLPQTHTLGQPTCYAPLNWQLAMKLSHRFKRSAHFKKTREDILTLRSLGAKIPDMDWFKRRCKETYHGHPNLRQRKATFFDTPGVEYIYDHDTIHQAMAVRGTPMYLRYKSDDAEVWCDRSLWESLTREEQLIGVMEEALVLALERSQVPFNFEPDPDWSFDKALEAVCTTVTSGWFRAFAWENYEDVLDIQKRMMPNYVDVFKQAVEDGIVKEV